MTSHDIVHCNRQQAAIAASKPSAHMAAKVVWLLCCVRFSIGAPAGRLRDARGTFSVGAKGVELHPVSDPWVVDQDSATDAWLGPDWTKNGDVAGEGSFHLFRHKDISDEPERLLAQQDLDTSQDLDRRMFHRPFQKFRRSTSGWGRVCNKNYWQAYGAKNLGNSWKGDCTITGGVGNQILILPVGGGVTFHGNLRLRGRVAFEGRRHMRSPCLRVLGDLVLEEGVFLHVKYCHSAGGAVVNNWKQHAATSVAFFGIAGPCLQVHSSLIQLGGVLYLEKCSSQHSPGGGLVLGSGAFIHTAGLLAIWHGRAPSGGGIYISPGHPVTWTGGSGGNVKLVGCHAYGGSGGGISGGGMRLKNVNFMIMQCHAEKIGQNVEVRGGAIHFQGVLELIESNMSIEDCSAHADGGGISGIATDGSDTSYAQLILNRSILKISRCRSQLGHGGGLFLDGSLLGRNGSQVALDGCSAHAGGGAALSHFGITGRTFVAIRRCSTEGPGGGLFLNGTWYSESATAEFSRCTSDSDGGGAFIQSVDMAGPNSTLNFSGCISRGGYGGGIFLKGNMITKHANIILDSCTAQAGGGCIASADVDIFGGQAAFRWCYALRGDGGGLLVKGAWNVRYASVDFLDAGAVGGGGGASVENAYLAHAQVTFTRCSASSGYGGGLQVQDALVSKNVVLSFAFCRAGNGGGCCSISKNADVHGGLTAFQDCQVDAGSGGCLYLSGRWRSKGAKVTFADCAASGNGGCAAMSEAYLASSANAMSFTRCRATFGSGGGLQLNESLSGQGSKLTFKDCTAGKGGGCAALKAADLDTSQMTFAECHAQGGDGGGLLTEGTLRGKDLAARFLDCTAGAGGGGFCKWPGYTRQPGD